MKNFFSAPPLLDKPKEGEILYLYLSVIIETIISVMVREHKGE